MALLLFFLLAIVAVTAALGMVLSPNLVHSVLFLVVVILALAALFVTLDAEFLAVLQVVVYAGAIMVLFLFVIMMLNLNPAKAMPGILGRPAGFVVAVLLMSQLAAAAAVGLGRFGKGTPPPPPPGPHGSVENVGGLLLTRYVIPVELASLMLLAGMVGAVALTRPWRGETQSAGAEREEKT